MPDNYDMATQANNRMRALGRPSSRQEQLAAVYVFRNAEDAEDRELLLDALGLTDLVEQAKRRREVA